MGDFWEVAMNFDSVVLWVQHVIMPVVMETATSFGVLLFLKTLLVA
jgi:hypothetical protein